MGGLAGVVVLVAVVVAYVSTSTFGSYAASDAQPSSTDRPDDVSVGSRPMAAAVDNVDDDPIAADGPEATPTADDCDWWDVSSGPHNETSCSSAALRRMMGADGIGRAIARSQECALRHGLECVLSHEVGLHVPAALMWRQSEGRMRMVLLPKFMDPSELVDSPTDATSGGRSTVALVRPPFPADGLATHLTRSTPRVVFNRTVHIDHVDVHTHLSNKETFVGDEAFCLQMLRLSVPEDCRDIM